MLPALNALAEPAIIKDGTKIERPGVYAMTMDWYHADCCVTPSISSSGLRTIWSQSPAHFFLNSVYNPNAWEWRVIDGIEVYVRKEDTDRPHFSLGRAAHHLLFLGRKGFDREFVVRPSKWKDWRTADAREWAVAQRKNKLTIITDSELEWITGMARSLAAHPLVKAGIMEGYVERSLIWRDEATGVWFKSRPDCIPNDSGDVADLKTMASVETESMMRSISDFGYPMQGALVGMGMRQVLQREMQSFTLVCVEPRPPHSVRVVSLKPDDLERGERKITASARMFANAFAEDAWPGPAGDQQDAEYMDCTEWSRRRDEDKLARWNLHQ